MELDLRFVPERGITKIHELHVHMRGRHGLRSHIWEGHFRFFVLSIHTDWELI